MTVTSSLNTGFPLSIADGGTGVNDLTPTHGVLYANGTGAVQVLPELSDGYLIIGNSSNPPNAAAVTSTGSTIAIGGTAGGLNLDIQAPVNVAHGGTGIITATAYGTVVAGTTSTGAFSTVSPGTSGYVLTSNGASAYPTYQAAGGSGFTSINVQTFTTAGSFTYTPTSGMQYCIVEIVGGGGGGGGTYLSSSSAGSGGGGGGYARQLFSAATIGASKPVTVGAGGAAAIPPTAPGNGGSSYFGSAGALLNVSGGTAGVTDTNSSTSNPWITIGGAGGSSVGSLGYINIIGSPGGNSFTFGNVLLAAGGFGGATPLGSSAAGYGISGVLSAYIGQPGYFGSGGGGGATTESIVAAYGGAGGAGAIIITEFI